MNYMPGILWAFAFLSVGGCIGFLFGAMCRVASDADEQIDAAKAWLIHRLQEMEYAVEGGNSAREDVPADTLKSWFRYVWTGEDVE
jgi:hypothetical protein